MKKILLMFSMLLFFVGSVWSQDDIPVNYDFSSFRGDGLSATPTSGQLDSDSWSFIGFSTTSDLSRGTTDGGVTTGGLYSLVDNVLNPTDGAIWIQPGGSDFTPGDAELTVCNNDGASMTNIQVRYDIKYLNDQGRSNSINFLWVKTSGGTDTPVSSADFTTPLASDGSGVQTVNRDFEITGVNLADGDCLRLTWRVDDEAGSGSRDELGIDNIEILEAITTPINLAAFTAKPMDAQTVSLDWSTATEENNEYFNIEHSTDGREFTAIDQVEGALNSTETLYYNYMHKDAAKGMNYYRLRQVDTDGTFSFSPIEVVDLGADVVIQARPTLAKSSVQLVLNESLDQSATVQVYDVLGRIVATEVLARGATQLDINVNNFENGHYFIHLNDGVNAQMTRFIKR